MDDARTAGAVIGGEATAILPTRIEVRREDWSFAVQGTRLRVALRRGRILPDPAEVAGLGGDGVEVHLGALEQITSTLIAWLVALKRLVGVAEIHVLGLRPTDRAVLARVGATRFVRLPD